MSARSVIAILPLLLLSPLAAAGEALLTPGAQLTYQITRSARSAEARAVGQNTMESTCTLAAIAGGPASFQALELQCDRQWRCGAVRSEQWLAYTSAGLQTFSTRPGAQTTPAEGTVIQAGALEHGEPFSHGGASGFAQCQTTTVTQGSRPGRPNAQPSPQNRPPREITTCSAYEVGFVSSTGPACSIQLSAVAPAAEAPAAAPAPPAAASATTAAPAAEPAPAAASAPPAGNPALTFDAGAEGQELNLLLGDGSTVLNPLDMIALNEAYCWASSTPTFQGVQAFVSHVDLPEGSTIEAQLMGSTAMLEDEYGYMECDESQMKLLGGASVTASGTASQTIAVRTSAPMPSWPCALEISAVVMKGAGDMVEPVLETEPTSMWITCPE